MPIANILLFAVAVLAPTLLFWALLRVPRVVDGLGAFVRRRRPAQPVAPPIERLTADLHRVHRTLAGYPPGTAARVRAERSERQQLERRSPHRRDGAGSFD